MKFEIAIPSYGRCDILPKKSLKLLLDLGVMSKDIRIFLRDEEELKKYQRTCGKAFNYQLTGQTGIDSTRNYLRDYYHNRTKLDGVLFMDDDITKLTKLDKPVENFMELLNYFFTETKNRGLRLFGINAVSNPFFMKDNISTNLKWIIGAFCGLILDRTKPVIFCDVGHFEDYQFTMEHFLEDGGVVRFNAYGLETKYFEKEGGICGSLGGLENRQKEMEENVEHILDRYGDMCKLKMKKHGHDIRLNHNYKIE